MHFLSFDFEQVSAPAGFAAGGTSQCGLHYTRIVQRMNRASYAMLIFIFLEAKHDIASFLNFSFFEVRPFSPISPARPAFLSLHHPGY
jgi:hypothetical protein